VEPAEAMALKDERIRDRLREVVQKKGRPIRFEDEESYRYPGEQDVSIYGWVDHDAEEHMENGDCIWSIGPTARLVERTYTEFGDTMNGNDDVIGINVSPAHCTCGEYRNMHLRYTESFGTILRDMLNVDNGISI